MARAALLAHEAPLRQLVSDVLEELGVGLLPAGELLGADVVLVHLRRGDEAALQALAAGRGGRPPPLLALLPFADEGLHAHARRLGASGCYALGTPLALLKARVREALPSLARR